MAFHPLEPLTGEEIDRVGAIVKRTIAEEVGKKTSLPASEIEILFTEIALSEPRNKESVCKRSGGNWLGNGVSAPDFTVQIPRLAEAICVINTTRETAVATVRLADSAESDRINSLEITSGKVQPAFSEAEYGIVEEVVKVYPPFIKLCEEAGIDVAKVRADPWCPGYFSEADDPARRIAWPALYYEEDEGDNIYARPLDGVEIVVDLQTKEVLKFERIPGRALLPLVPKDPLMNYESKDSCSSEKKNPTLKPINISQPEGASFTVERNKVSWQGWKFHVGFTSREGLTLNLLEYQDRPVAYRASFCEMVVPYGDPEYPNYLKNAFDAGEDGLGRNAHSLKLGCDCKGLIYYFDAFMTSAEGTSEPLEHAVCMHEEDDGVSWKHMNWRTGHTEVRRRRKLVVSFFCTIANYEYGFFIDLHQDGGIEFNVKLTGIVSTAVCPPGTDSKYGTTLFRGNPSEKTHQIYAPTHQHFFVARLDMSVDGLKNRIQEVNVYRESAGDHNPHFNAFYADKKLLESELEAIRDCNTASARHWVVESTTRVNRIGEPTGYVLHPHASTPPLGDPRAKIFQRAGFLQKQLWVTPFEPTERYPGGDFPNQCKTVEGLPKWTAKNRNLVDEDLVIWHIFGTTHVARLEDWPVMPVAQISFKLEPFGFMDASPVIDLDKECSSKGVDEYAKPVPQERNKY